MRAVSQERALFDERSYVEFYPDIAAAGVDPFGHFMSTGWQEGRHPSALFDAGWYANQFAGEASAAANPLTHYLTTGGPQGWSPSPLFDARAYAAYRKCQPGADFLPLLEFLNAEPEHAFNPCPLFDTDWFFSTYPDVAQLDENYLLFFARTGARNGYNPSPHFDCDWYLRQYPDVAASAWNPLAHYLAVGQYEGRNPLPPTAGDVSETLLPLVGAHETYGEYSSQYSGEAVIIPDEPFAGKEWSGRLAVHLHIFYEDMLELLGAHLRNIPAPFSLFVSVPDMDLAERARRYFERFTGVQKLRVKIVQNRGRDLAPLIVDFADELRDSDLIIHLHSKKSVHTDEKRDWPVQMLHHLLASHEHAAQLLAMFEADHDLGLVFPIYHSSIREQIIWGGNRPKATGLLSRLGASEVPDICPAFPAGSFFAIRTSLLKPLWELELSHDDFEEEDGAMDGTLAHAVERVLGMLPELRGMHFRQVGASVPHSLGRSWLRDRQYSSPLLQKIASGEQAFVPASEVTSARELNIVVYSCATKGYDVPLPVEHALAGVNYHFLTDAGGDVNGLWQLSPLQFDASDPILQARLHKASPHILFPDADIAIWVDANIAITGDLSVYVQRLLEADASFGLVRHPIRNSFVEEARALSKLGIEKSETLAPQIGQYLLDDLPDDLGLTETNFMLMDLRNPETTHALDLWRTEMITHSVRDQVSFDYARWRSRAQSVWLFDEGGSVRSNPRFAYFAHGGMAHAQRDAFSGKSYRGDLEDNFNERSLAAARLRAQERTVDVIIPVHNAPDDTAACINALNADRDERIRIIIVDDGSEGSTSEILRQHVRLVPNDMLIRHEEAKGYTRAANAGLRASRADVAVLLNSDTIVSPGAIRKLVAALERNDGAGLAGPLSNAAGWQSVPEQVNPDGDYAVNELLSGMTLDDIAVACERLVLDPHIAVPALNGFCLAIARPVIDRIGYLDEAAFPEGYGEETDYCFRAVDDGFVPVIAGDAFVFHAKSRSFGHERRKALSEAGFQVLIERYGQERLDRTLRELANTSRLRALRDSFRRLGLKSR